MRRSQAKANGQVLIGNGLRVTGESTIVGGLAATAAGITLTGSMLLSTGTQTVTNPATSGFGLSIASNGAGFGGNALAGRVNVGATNGNLLTLTDTVSTFFQVSVISCEVYVGFLSHMLSG